MKVFESLAHRILLWLEKREVSYYTSKMKLGKRVRIERGLSVKRPQNIRLGDDVSIGSKVFLHAHAPIDIGNLTLIGPRVMIVTTNHDMLDGRNNITASVTIGRNCWLGAGVIVLPGVSIGDNTTIGAGSIVSKNLPPDTVCVGIPAKPIKSRSDTELQSK